MALSLVHAWQLPWRAGGATPPAFEAPPPSPCIHISCRCFSLGGCRLCWLSVAKGLPATAQAVHHRIHCIAAGQCCHAAHLLPGGRPAQRASDPVATGICARGAGHPRHLSVIPAPATGLAPAGGFSGGAVQRGPRAVGPAPQGLQSRCPPPLRPQAGVKHASSCSIQRVFSASLAKLASKLFLASCCQVAASNWNAACTARILSFR